MQSVSGVSKKNDEDLFRGRRKEIELTSFFGQINKKSLKFYENFVKFKIISKN